jgi:diaminopimelate epimerase
MKRKTMDIFDCFPGGNSTYLCFAEGIDRSEYVTVDSHIRECIAEFEQGGFLEKCRGENVVRLQMAGGEFCGNAARSAGALITHMFLNCKVHEDLVKYDRIVKDGEFYRFSIAVSGIGQPVGIKCKPLGDVFLTEVTLPMKAGIVATKHEVSIYGRSVIVQKVPLEGIVHVLIDEESMPFVEKFDDQVSLLRTIEKALHLENEPAIGLIWHSEEDSRRHIDPLVFVRATGALIHETACGSGSLALAIALSGEHGGDAFSIVQPSRYPIDCSLTVDSVSKEITQASLSGFVFIKNRIPLDARCFDDHAASLAHRLQCRFRRFVRRWLPFFRPKAPTLCRRAPRGTNDS